MSATQRLLSRARTRLRVADFGRKFRAAFLVIAGIAFAALLAARLLAILPASWFTPVTLASGIGAALLGALVFSRRLTTAAVARAVDQSAGTKELFLTAALIPETPGAYQEVVLSDADARAAKLSAGKLLAFRWQRGARDVLIASAAIAAAYLWLPQLDPFRREAVRQEVSKKAQRAEELKKITVSRKEELAEKGSALSEQVDVALAKLDQALKEAKPKEQAANAKKLNEQAQDFSELWKRLSEQLPKNTADQLEKAAQAFGDTKQQEALKEAISQLKKGDPKALQEMLQKMQEQMKAAAQQGDPAEQKKEVEKLARELAKMSEQIRQQLGEKGMNEALQRALEQMDLSQLKELAKDALDGANQSLELSQQELQRMAEMFKDMQNVEDALKNLQAAKQLNEKGKLDGQDAQGAGAKTPQDYEELYKKLLADIAGMQPGDGGGEGDKPGKGGKSGNQPGIGQGGSVGEDPNAKTGMKDEKSKSQLGAGKLLMQWKEEGVGEVGQRAADYEAAARAVKEGVAEAIRNEQIPPGYHPAIQKYFDQLPAKAPEKK